MDIDKRKKDLMNWKKALRSLPKDAPEDAVQFEKRRYANLIRFALCTGDNVWQRYYDTSSTKMLDEKIKTLECVYLGKLGKSDKEKIDSILEKKPKNEEMVIW